ncbi:glycosyltransferase [Desulfovibrio sp. DV]|uniref:glycosyltransferase n=1 Tax=Desulfovibrio sp. DV TaxID=1844708 RepID=UPI00094BA75F|nr:glycosyltransferase [Desulfovibrio sp. DV]
MVGAGLSGRRVAQVILNMTYGGGERLVQELAVDLEDAGARSLVVCLDSIQANTAPLEARGIEITLVKRRQMALDAVALARLTVLLRKRGTQLVHAHDLASLAYAVPAGLVLGIPVLFTEHSRHYLDARLRRRLEKRLLCLGVRRLVEVSPELAGASVARDGVSPRRVAVIENGVDLTAFAGGGGELFRRECGLNEGQLLVGMVGRLEDIKGPQVLLEAFVRVAGNMPQARLVFVGDGSLRRELEAKAVARGLGGKVRFTGARPDIPQVMGGLDVLVLPSLSEGLPFALLEGMAAGRAVAASAVGRIPGIVQDGESGMLLPAGDAGALAGALAGLLADADLRQRLGRAARLVVAARYDRRHMLDAYREMYASVLSREGQGREATWK